MSDTADDPRPRSDDERTMAKYLSMVATGPRLSKNLSRAQACDAMSLILDERVEPVQAAVFLVALRMKRETHDELCGVLDALRACTRTAIARVDDLVDIAEPYNGYVRHAPATPFVPALLAACGVPAVLHGSRQQGPKFGVTSHQILRAAGRPIDLDAECAAEAVARCGWAYLDVSGYCPSLARLARLRTLVVKRPCLSLVEKLLRPVVARQRSHLWVGYTHREYPEILDALARDLGYHSMLAVRGVEGGVLTSLSGAMRAARYLRDEGDDAPLTAIDIAAAEAGVLGEVRAPALPDAAAASAPHGKAIGVDLPAVEQVEHWAEIAAEAGWSALRGRPGTTADMLVLGAAAVLRHLGRAGSLESGARIAREALASGEAARRFEALVG